MTRKILVHIHQPGKRVTLDLAPPPPPSLATQYQDLMDRLLAALSKHTKDARPAAGVACFNQAGLVLLMKRRPDCSDHPGEWAFPAGGIDPGETAEQAARREFREETGKNVYLLRPLGAWENFIGFKTYVPSFAPRLCHEHTAYQWADPKKLPADTHPGVVAVLNNRLTQDDAEDDQIGHWITLNGAHVFVNGQGQITKGPAHLVGKHKDEITGGAGPKKSVKQQVHEILSSGKPFTLADMHKATGAKYEKQIYNAIVDMNAGKGPVPGLKIEKVGPKTWQIVQADGTPAPAIPPDAPAGGDDYLKTLFGGEHEKAPETKQDEPPAVETAPVAPTPTPPGPKALAGFVAKAPATTLSKAEADEKYHGALTEATDQAAHSMKELAEAPDGINIEEYTKSIAQEWKQTKANAMAQWAADFKGGDHSAKPVQVFPEDVALMDALTSADTGEEKAKAIADWKKATAAAKTKTVPAAAPVAAPASTPAAAPPPPAPAPKIDTIPTGGPALSTPETIVPDDHDHIAHDDFTSTPDAPEGAYVKHISKQHQMLHADDEGAAANKKRIQKHLDAELANSPHFKSLDDQYRTNGPGKYGHTGSDTLAAKLISQWATSSGNHHAISVAAQLATREAFKMDPEKTETKAFHILGTHDGDEEKVYKEAAQELGIKANTPESMASFKHGLQDFALAQYHATQKHLAEKGITHMYLVRGMKFGESNAKAKQVNVKMQPASSFTTNHSTAVGFSGGHSLFVAKVPASQVLSSFITGYGCTSESEVVVLNHDNMKLIKIGKAHASSQSQMAKSIKEHLAADTPPVPKDPNAPPAPATFKPKNLPKPDLGVSKGWAKALKTAAVSGDLEAFNVKHDQVMAMSAHVPKTKAYAAALKEHLTKQHAEFVEAQTKKAEKLAAKQTKAPTTTKSTTTPTTAEGVKKNAHYYKKLKAAVLGHPLHSDAVYKGLKEHGHSNEAILNYYQTQQAKYNGKDAT